MLWKLILDRKGRLYYNLHSMNLVKTIFLVRHGMTAYNEEDILQGRIDLPLSDKGKKETESLSEKLKNEHLDIIFHSPLKRAIQTAQIVNKHHHL
jgi:broad specificity phosphatase PhoE